MGSGHWPLTQNKKIRAQEPSVRLRLQPISVYVCVFVCVCVLPFVPQISAYFLFYKHVLIQFIYAHAAVS